MVELIVAAAAVYLDDHFVLIVVYLVAPSDCHWQTWNFDSQQSYDDELMLDVIHIVLRDHRLEIEKLIKI